MSEKKHDHDIAKQPPPVKTEKDYARVCPSKLTKRELEELYFALVDNNTELKKSLNQQLDKIRQLNTKVARLANIQKTALAKDGSGRNACCASTKAAMAEQNISILELKKANERMADRVRVLNTRLCSARQFLRRASPQPSIHRCPKCNAGVALKDAAVSPNKKGESKTEAIDIAIQESPEFLDAATGMSDPEFWMTQCKEERETMIEGLQNKISSLEDELSRTHKDYSSRINRLEQLLSRLQQQAAAARATSAAAESDIAARLEHSRARHNEIEEQLSMEKKKVAELETQLKSALLSNEVAKTIETHLSNVVCKSVTTNKEVSVNTHSCEPAPLSSSCPKEQVEVRNNSYRPPKRTTIYDPEKVEVQDQNYKPSSELLLQVPNKDIAVDAQSYEIAPKVPFYVPNKEIYVHSHSDNPVPQAVVSSKDIAVHSNSDESTTKTAPFTSKEVAANTYRDDPVPKALVPSKDIAVHSNSDESTTKTAPFAYKEFTANTYRDDPVPKALVPSKDIAVHSNSDESTTKTAPFASKEIAANTYRDDPVPQALFPGKDVAVHSNSDRSTTKTAPFTSKEVAANTYRDDPVPKALVPRKDIAVHSNSDESTTKTAPFASKEVAANTYRDDPVPKALVPSKDIAVHSNSDESTTKTAPFASKEVAANSYRDDPEPQALFPSKHIAVHSNSDESTTKTAPFALKEVAANTYRDDPVPQALFPSKHIAVHSNSDESTTKTAPFASKEVAANTYRDDPVPKALVPRKDIAVHSNSDESTTKIALLASKEVAVNTYSDDPVPQIPFLVPKKESAVNTVIQGSYDAESRRNSECIYPNNRIEFHVSVRGNAFVCTFPRTCQNYLNAKMTVRLLPSGTVEIRLALSSLTIPVDKQGGNIWEEILRRTSSDRDNTLSKVISYESVITALSTDYPGRVSTRPQESGRCEACDKKQAADGAGIVTPTPDVNREYEEARYLTHFIDKLRHSVSKIKQSIFEHKETPVHEQEHVKSNKQVSIQGVTNACEDASVDERPCHDPAQSAHFYEGPVQTEPIPEFDDIDVQRTRHSFRHAHRQNGWNLTEPTYTQSAISDQPISKADSKIKPRRTSVDYVPEQYEKLPLLSSNKHIDKNAAISPSSTQDFFPSDPKLEINMKVQHRSTADSPEQYEKLYSCIKNMDTKKNEAQMHSADALPQSSEGTQRASRRRDNDDSGIADKSVEARDDFADSTNRELQRQIESLQKQLDELKKSTLKEPACKRRDSASQSEKRKKSLDLQSFDVEIYKADVPVLRNFNDCKYYVVDPEKTVVVEVEDNHAENEDGPKDVHERDYKAPTSSKNVQPMAPKAPYRPSIELMPRCDSRTSSQIREAKFLNERQDSDDGQLMMSVFDSKRKINSVGTDRMNSLAKDAGSEIGPRLPFINKEMYEDAVQRQNEEDAEICTHKASVCRCPRALRDVTTFRSCSGTLRFTTSGAASLRACERCQRCDAGTQPEAGRLPKNDPTPKRYSRKSSEVATYTIERPPVSSRSEGTSPDDTHYDISSIADSHPKSSSPEDKWTSTQSSAPAQTSRDAYLSEGEVPNSNKERKFSVGEKPLKRSSGDNNREPVDRELPENKMESALQAINQELVRCRRLLQSKREYQLVVVAGFGMFLESVRASSPSPARQLELRKVSGARELNNAPPQKCVFTLHIGTIVLSDEAVIKTRDKSLMLTWQFYEQTPAMTRMRGGRVVHFDFSTEYDVKVSDQFLRYLKHEELRIMICAVDKPNRPFAQAALPLRDALLNLNHRVDMSLALTATETGEDMLRHSRTGDDGDELGVLDLWCTLRAEPWIVSNFKKSFPSEVLLPTAAPAAAWPLSARRRGGSTLLLDEDPASTRLEQDMDMRWNTGTAIEWSKTIDKTPDESSSTAGFWDSLPELSSIPQHSDQPSEEQKLFNQLRTEKDPITPLPHTNSKLSYEVYPDGLRGRQPRKSEDGNEAATGLAADTRKISTNRPSNMRSSLRGMSSVAGHSVLDMLRDDKWRQMNYEPPERDENQGHGHRQSAEENAERDGTDVGAKLGWPSERKGSHLHMGDSKKVTIGPSTYNLDDLAEPSADELEDKVSITVLWLALDSASSAMSDRRVRRLYVAYTFLGHSGAELETPISLPKPKHHADKCYFDFKKTFSIGPSQWPLLAHMSRQRASPPAAAAPRPDPLDCVIFSVVSEPAEDPLGLASCVDIGYAYLYLGSLLAYSSGDSYTEVLRVHEAHAYAHAHTAVCGVLAVRVDGLDVVRAAAKRPSN